MTGGDNFVIAIMVALFSWWYWSPSYDTEGLIEFASKMESVNSFGSPYFIEKSSAIATWHPTVLVFGYINDASVCYELITSQMQQYPALRLRCVPAVKN